MKRLCIYILAALVLFAACKKPDNPQPAEGTEETTTEQTPETNNPTTTTMNEQPAAPADKWAELGEEPMLKIKTTDGTMTVKLYAETPLHRDNFVKLARSGFYNGLLFHRIIKGFMIQGGDPTGTGMGGPGYRIKGEFKQNGFINPIKHTRGVISMARSMMPNSAGSQFFIMHEDAPHLDGGYAAFGRVTEGMEAVDRIASCETGAGDRPVKEQKMKKVTVEDFGEQYPFTKL